jgi:arginine utilization protein RocB
MASVPVIASNTPVFGHAIAWPAEGAVAGIPSVNLGPWGRDYHTPLERLHGPYAFEVLPGLIEDLVADVLGA